MSADIPAAVIVTLYQEVRTTIACIIAPTVVYVYDYILCLGRESQYVWHSGKSKASRLVYLYIRYISLMNLVIALGTIEPVSDIAIRAVTVVARSCAIIADCITIVVTWRATRTSRKVISDSFQQPSLQDVMWTNGNIYFITVMCGNLLDLILATLSITDPENNANWPIGFIDPITAILNCRFLLDLYETNSRLERGGSSFSQSDMSLHFTGSKAGDAPENSYFLSSFSGPVLLDSFSDESEDTALDTFDEKPEAEPAVPAEAPAMEAGGSSTAA
ncbi:hypothetical protein C2E23DRAFT_885226 [Lenzites betulinus]|nr:hypothetical protein C2E23DRAFT_885226 [Lenzites betulinus]